MQYMLQFYSTPEEFAARDSPEGHKAFRSGFVPYMKALQDAGVVVVGAGLQKPETATSLRINGGGSHHVQDGLFADTKEQLGGFFIIEVPDMDAALKWAARYPGAPGGGVEVRPALPKADLEALHKMLAEA
jgi:hypothetical protein